MKLNSILNTFNKTLSQLNAFAKATNKEIITNERKTAELVTATEVKRAEVVKAQKTAENIRKLLGEVK